MRIRDSLSKILNFLELLALDLNLSWLKFRIINHFLFQMRHLRSWIQPTRRSSSPYESPRKIGQSRPQGMFLPNVWRKIPQSLDARYSSKSSSQRWKKLHLSNLQQVDDFHSISRMAFGPHSQRSSFWNRQGRIGRGIGRVKKSLLLPLRQDF